jgi:hypothetical protein
MASSSGPNIVTDGLLLSIDAGNRKSAIDAVTTSLIDTSSWADGQTSTVSYYTANQSVVTENVRVLDTDPWGKSSVVWETRPSGDGNQDGGWNTNYFAIDRTKTYRFSVWVRRTSTTANGIFYLGLNTNGTNSTILLNNTTQTNPYWDYRGVDALTQNQWYLVNGHIFPAGYTGTTAHPDSGFYTTSGGTTKVASNAGNIPDDVKFPTDATLAYHRTYHYYDNTDSTTRLQFAYPRIDVCDGSQPTISELLSANPTTIKNTIGTNYSANMNSQNAISSGVFNTVGTGRNGYAQISDLNLTTGTYTIMCASRYTGANRGRIIAGVVNNWLLGHWGNSTENYYAAGWVSGVSTGANDTVWRIYAGTGDSVADVWKKYVNGILIDNNAGGTQGPSGLQIGGYGPTLIEMTDGQVGFLLVYNRVLTDAEVLQNFNALRGRYGI